MTIKFIKCPSCKGAKRMMGMGMILQECSVCKGQGIVEDAGKRKRPKVKDDELPTKSVKVENLDDGWPREES